MYWVCKSCNTKNPENARKCGKCGATTDAPKKFYTSAIFGAAVVFLLMYFVGTFVGGILVGSSLVPSEIEILAMANSQAKAEGLDPVEKFENPKPEARDKAKEAVIADSQKKMSLFVYVVLFWFFTFLLFPAIGAVFGYVTAGRTVIEAAIGSVIGQVIGFALMVLTKKADLHWLELVIGVVVGFFVVAAGAYVGEAVQEKRERAVLEASEAEEY